MQRLVNLLEQNMNRDDWLDLFINTILQMLLTYAKRHSYDAAQEVMSLVSLGIADHERQHSRQRELPGWEILPYKWENVDASVDKLRKEASIFIDTRYVDPASVQKTTT